MNFFIPLIFTILIEFIVYVILIKKRVAMLFFYSILINSFTNPLANLAADFNYNFILIEFLVFVVETLLIKKLFGTKYNRAVLISLLANLITSISGFLPFPI